MLEPDMAKEIGTEAARPAAPPNDLGFGAVVSERRHLRLLNRDGSFNVLRKQSNWFRRLTSYHTLLTISWPRFILLVILGYLLLNALFAGAYMACGTAALEGATWASPFWRAFFFSVETFGTIGYGNIVPTTFAANMVVTVEAVVGLLAFALATGLLFARFSRPTAAIQYTQNALIAPYYGLTSLQFRVINGRDNQIIELQAVVMLARFEDKDGLRQRKFYSLKLERTRVAFFPLTWTIVHPIDEESPLFGWTHQGLQEADGEILVLLTGTDETFAQQVHSRSSYSAHEIVWEARWRQLYEKSDQPIVSVDMKRFHEYERVERT